jgi:hypothetical protein
MRYGARLSAKPSISRARAPWTCSVGPRLLPKIVRENRGPKELVRATIPPHVAGHLGSVSRFPCPEFSRSTTFAAAPN